MLTATVLVLPFNTLLFLLAGDVLQLPVPVRGVDLLPDPGSAPEGLRGRDPSHVHTQGRPTVEAALPLKAQQRNRAVKRQRKPLREEVFCALFFAIGGTFLSCLTI